MISPYTPGTAPDKVLSALAEASPGALTTEQVSTASGLLIHHTRTTLHTLFRAGHIQRSKAGGRGAKPGDKQRAWRVKPEVDQ